MTFIVNPASGNGRGYRIWNKIARLLQQNQVHYHVFMTDKPNQATDFARQLVSHGEVDVIVAVGGDGTAHEVANGLIGSEVSMGYIPAGSGNDFARGIGIPNDYKKALERILTAQKHAIDIVKISVLPLNETKRGNVQDETAQPCEQAVISVLGIGFDAEVARATNQSRYKTWLNHFHLGKLSYVFSLFKVLFLTGYRPTDIWLEWDNGQKQVFSNVWLVAAANTPFYGGGMKICPDALCDDGLLNVCIVHDVSIWQFLHLFPRVFNGTHVYHPHVTILRGEQFSITAKNRLVIHGDGELLGKTPAQVTIQKKALRIIV